MNNTVMLKRNNEFKFVFLKGKFYRAGHIDAFILKNSLDYNKLGLAISRKVGKSVRRNQIKRYIRECYWLNEKRLMQGYTFVFLWNKNYPPELANFINVKNDLESIFKKADVFVK